MPRKLTVLGALMAVVLGALGVMRDASPSAEAAIQVFTPNVTVCYGGAPAVTFGVCNGGSTTTATSGAALTTYQQIALPEGSRLTLPITFTPNDWGFDPNGSGELGTTGCYDDDDDVDPTGAGEDITCVTGDVTSRTDLLCNDGDDILADVASTFPSGALVGWPDPAEYIPFDFGHLYDSANIGGLAGDVRNSYVLAIKPTPLTYTTVSLDKAPLHNVLLSGFVANPLNPPTPLQTLTEQGPGFRTSTSLLAGSPNGIPDSQFLCLDSPQDSASMNNQLIAPVPDGRYPRWTIFTSAADIVDGKVSRIIDSHCIVVGAPGADADGDCMVDASEAGACLADIDCDDDLLIDGVEDAYGSGINNAGGSADDGVSDYVEMFQMTDPGSANTDGDTSGDLQDNGADENGAAAGVIDTAADDNCPLEANDAQTNSDSGLDLTGTPPPDGNKDSTNPNEDTDGDLCDSDNDNDGIGNVAELALYIRTTGVPATNVAFCTDVGDVNPIIADPTDPLDPDTDDDLGLDGRECVFESDPNAPGSRMLANSGADGDLLSDEGANGGQLFVGGERFFRTRVISQVGGIPNNDPDGDGYPNPGGPPGFSGDADSDNDRAQDGIEVKYYASSPSNPDTDRDGCTDGKEIGSINDDRTVGSADLGQAAARFGNYFLGSGAVNSLVKANYDFNRDRTIGSTDLGLIAGVFGACASSFETGPVVLLADQSRQ